MATFAYPPRKVSDPRSYGRSPRSRMLNRARLRYIAVVVTLVLFGLWLVSRIFGSSSSSSSVSSSSYRSSSKQAPLEVVDSRAHPFVLVTTINRENMSEPYIEAIMENRREYAARHGYATFFPNTSDYHVGPVPSSWARIPAMRHAMTLYPSSTYFFFLSPTALIMNPLVALSQHLTAPETIESIMIRDKPVVPPDSVIHTFVHLKGEKVEFFLTQDKMGLAVDSFVLKRSEWSKYFLDAWFDPLYRTYNFQKAERHALEHIIQWHGTMLAKLALVPQNIINSYTGDDVAVSAADNAKYEEGDFIANFVGCDRDETRNCFKEMRPLFNRWREIRDRGAR